MIGCMALSPASIGDAWRKHARRLKERRKTGAQAAEGGTQERQGHTARERLRTATQAGGSRRRAAGRAAEPAAALVSSEREEEW